jgi:hypothetical protein
MLHFQEIELYSLSQGLGQIYSLAIVSYNIQFQYCIPSSSIQSYIWPVVWLVQRLIIQISRFHSTGTLSAMTGIGLTLDIYRLHRPSRTAQLNSQNYRILCQRFQVRVNARYYKQGTQDPTHSQNKWGLHRKNTYVFCTQLALPLNAFNLSPCTSTELPSQTQNISNRLAWVLHSTIATWW